MNRRTALWALYWLAITTVAAVASLAAAIPFTGPAANTAGIVAAAGVCLVGIACAPTAPGTGARP